MNPALLSPDRLRGRLAYQGVLLATVALLTSAALSLADRSTAVHIAAAEARDLETSLSQVLPGRFDNRLLDDSVQVDAPSGPVTVYRARRDGQVVAVVFRVGGNGYAGPIDCMLGVDREGRVTGVRVLKHRETPGLGDKIEAGKGPWIHAFAGKSLQGPAPERWAVKKDGGDFDQFAGATVTPRAVVKAVKGGLAVFASERNRLLDDSPVGAGLPALHQPHTVDAGKPQPTKESP